jgi:hypothetical protein
MSQRFIRQLVGIVVLLLCFSVPLALAAEKEKTQGVQKTMTNDNYNWFTINNLFNWYGNNGNSSYNTSTANSGLEFPKGSGFNPIFEDGVVWGGFHKGRATPKVGGSTYKYGLQAGRVTGYGGATDDSAGRPPADDPTLPKYRVYKVRPDVTPSTVYANVSAAMEVEAALISRYQTRTPQTLFAQYQTDWNEWPAKTATDPNGLAPFKDVNGNGTYEPAVDIPGQPGSDQTLYYVANDLNSSRTANLYSSPPIGIEMHRTVWGYNLPGALGNTIFASTVMINKSGASLDSAFFVQWSDPDLGDAGDDYAGCDIGRSLGFIYNGDNYDATYGEAVPAAGYDFFQGPLLYTGNPSDSAVFRGARMHGFVNLGMTTFDFFINGSAIYTDPTLGAAGSDRDWYRLMNARISTTDGEFIDPTTGVGTKFALSGDPLTGKGWLDGTSGLVPGDRRICLVTGPFTLANRDTQELVVATIVGLGGDRISSIAVLKYYSDLAQSAYNSLFNISRPPPSPDVKVTMGDGEITLLWADTVGHVKIENWNSNGWVFEGYNVYQLAANSPTLTGAKRLATYDVVNAVTTIFDDQFDEATGYIVSKPAQYGSDFGVKRNYTTKTDALTKTRLLNGSTYYFAVTSYSFNPSPTAKPAQLESSPSPLTVIPQWALPGSALHTTAGTELPIVHTVGISTAQTYATVIDPARVAGKNYEVRIVVTDSVMNDDLGIMVPNPKWVLYDAGAGRALTDPSTDYNFSNANPIVEGVQFGISGAPFYVAGKELGEMTWTPGDLPFTGINDTPYPADLFINSILTADQVAQDVQMEWVGQGNGQNAYMFLRTATGGSATAPYDGYYPQPFKCYELNPNGTRKRQIDFVFMEQVTSPTYNRIWWPGASSGNREYWFFVTETYSPTAKAKYTGSNLNSALVADTCVWSGWYTRGSADTAGVTGSVWTIKTTKIVTPTDRWTFSTAGLAPSVGNAALAANDVDKVNVFPNPYIGFNPQEANKYQRFVTLTHMPQTAVIRIFNLAGVLVRTLQKDDATQFLQWDLRNEQGFPVAAGMYLLHVEMPSQGKSKVLKLGVIPEQQFIDKW